jgi:hypothetical protein
MFARAALPIFGCFNVPSTQRRRVAKQCFEEIRSTIEEAANATERKYLRIRVAEKQRQRLETMNGPKHQVM